MKKTISVMLAAAMLLSCITLAGCGKKDEKPEDTRDKKEIVHEYRNTFRDNDGKPYSEDAQSIIENLPFTDTFDVSSIYFYMNEPYEANISYEVKKGEKLNEEDFRKNAYLIFSLVNEVYLVSFQPEGTGDRERIYFTRDQSYEVTGEDMFLKTEKYEDFLAIYDQIANLKSK